MGRHKSKSGRKWLCLDCGECTRSLREHYFVRGDVWFSVVESEIGMLCVGCLESRLGRRLVSGDFTPAWINDPRRNAMSTRLVDRITNGKRNG